MAASYLISFHFHKEKPFIDHKEYSGSLIDQIEELYKFVLSGKSKLRDPVLADIFHKMGIIEKWGTGLPRIFPVV